MRAPRVLVFDSGVGGLSVAACLHAAMPALRLSYLADTACFPYGDQSAQTVIERCVGLVSELMASDPVELVVVACNTASTVVLPTLREQIGVPVVGVVPAIKPAAALSENRRLGILATPATIRRPYTDDLIRQFARDCTITRVGHHGLVTWAEDKVSGCDVPLGALAAAVRPLAEAAVDTVVLGCTHYPLIRDELRQVLPDVKYWVDSGEAIARRVAFLLEETGRISWTTDSAFAGGEETDARFSGDAPVDLAHFMTGLGLRAGRIHSHWPAEITRPASV